MLQKCKSNSSTHNIHKRREMLMWPSAEFPKLVFIKSRLLLIGVCVVGNECIRWNLCGIFTSCSMYDLSLECSLQQLAALNGPNNKYCEEQNFLEIIYSKDSISGIHFSLSAEAVDKEPDVFVVTASLAEFYEFL
jgi:hypothetical protein